MAITSSPLVDPYTDYVPYGIAGDSVSEIAKLNAGGVQNFAGTTSDIAARNYGIFQENAKRAAEAASERNKWDTAQQMAEQQRRDEMAKDMWRQMQLGQESKRRDVQTAAEIKDADWRRRNEEWKTKADFQRNASLDAQWRAREQREWAKQDAKERQDRYDTKLEYAANALKIGNLSDEDWNKLTYGLMPQDKQRLGIERKYIKQYMEEIKRKASTVKMGVEMTLKAAKAKHDADNEKLDENLRTPWGYDEAANALEKAGMKVDDLAEYGTLTEDGDFVMSPYLNQSGQQPSSGGQAFIPRPPQPPATSGTPAPPPQPRGNLDNRDFGATVKSDEDIVRLFESGALQLGTRPGQGDIFFDTRDNEGKTLTPEGLQAARARIAAKRSGLQPTAATPAPSPVPVAPTPAPQVAPSPVLQPPSPAVQEPPTPVAAAPSQWLSSKPQTRSGYPKLATAEVYEGIRLGALREGSPYALKGSLKVYNVTRAQVNAALNNSPMTRPVPQAPTVDGKEQWMSENRKDTNGIWRVQSLSDVPNGIRFGILKKGDRWAKGGFVKANGTITDRDIEQATRD